MINRDLVIPAAVGILMIIAFLVVSRTLSSVLIFIPGVIVS